MPDYLRFRDVDIYARHVVEAGTALKQALEIIAPAAVGANFLFNCYSNSPPTRAELIKLLIGFLLPLFNRCAVYSFNTEHPPTMRGDCYR